MRSHMSTASSILFVTISMDFMGSRRCAWLTPRMSVPIGTKRDQLPRQATRRVRGCDEVAFPPARRFREMRWARREIDSGGRCTCSLR
jgi:hypothetical protein